MAWHGMAWHGINWGHVTTMCVYTCACACVRGVGLCQGASGCFCPPLGNDSSCPHWLLIFPYFNRIPPMHMYACVYMCACKILLCICLLLCVCVHVCVCVYVLSSVGSCLASNQVDINWSAQDAWLTVYSAWHCIYITHKVCMLSFLYRFPPEPKLQLRDFWMVLLALW